MSVSIAVTSVVSSGQSAHIARTLPRLSATFGHGLARGAPCLASTRPSRSVRVISSGLMNRHSIRHAACSLVTMGFERKRRRTRSHSRSYAAFCRRMTAASAATAAPIRARSPGPRPPPPRGSPFSRRARERCGERRRERARLIFESLEGGARLDARRVCWRAWRRVTRTSRVAKTRTVRSENKTSTIPSRDRRRPRRAHPRTCRYLR